MSRDGDDDPPDPEIPRRPYTLFVRAQLSHPGLPLVSALAGSPETDVRPRSPILGTDRFFFAGYGGDLAAFEDALVDDPTVESSALISEFADQRIYRADLTDRGRERLSAFDAADAYVHAARGTHDGWMVRMELPDRDSLVDFVGGCRAADVELNLQRITDSEGLDCHHDYGLSSEQESILRAAYQTGYFEVPRRVSQTDLAESFDLSTSAVSQNLRRATGELVGNTLLPRREP